MGGDAFREGEAYRGGDFGRARLLPSHRRFRKEPPRGSAGAPPSQNQGGSEGTAFGSAGASPSQNRVALPKRAALPGRHGTAPPHSFSPWPFTGSVRTSLPHSSISAPQYGLRSGGAACSQSPPPPLTIGQ